MIQQKNSQLDHIIPWEYVSDELDENLHMLCTICNQSKNKSVTFLLLAFLMRFTNKGYVQTV
ncbi:HNH endonuclease [Bacillus sp. FJAT-49732]|uniref:HNH endonuclease n=1 Tax=Lederbergia citrisecunda TaxID=2833583 RepID=A0A942TPS4_9BACI|nr:HNH endonuclease [Lederbergia citrisecunda]